MQKAWGSLPHCLVWKLARRAVTALQCLTASCSGWISGWMPPQWLFEEGRFPTDCRNNRSSSHLTERQTRQLRIHRTSYLSLAQSQPCSLPSASFLHGSMLLLNVRRFLYMQGGWGELITLILSVGNRGLLPPAACSAVADGMLPAHFLFASLQLPVLCRQAREVTQSVWTFEKHL